MDTSPSALLSRLDYSENAGFPKAAIQEIITRKDEMIPHLIAVLESAHADPQEYLDGPKAMLPTYAAYLLAQFRETRAYRPLIALLSLEGDLPEQFFGDSITEDICNLLACVFDGDEAPLRSLIENPAAEEYARGSAGLRTYPALLHAGRITATEVERYFHDLLDHKLEREHSLVWDNLCSVSADLGFASLLPLVRKAFEDDLCDPFFDRPEHIEKRIISGGDNLWMESCEPIDDVVATMENWACFTPEPTRRSSANPTPPTKPREFTARPAVPAPSAHPGVGRNDPCPCPCGSGRKFKKCCA